jgi:hypothetical protein
MLAIERLNELTGCPITGWSARADEEDANYWWRMSLRSLLMDVEEPFVLGLREAPATFLAPYRRGQ